MCGCLVAVATSCSRPVQHMQCSSGDLPVFDKKGARWMLSHGSTLIRRVCIKTSVVWSFWVSM